MNIYVASSWRNPHQPEVVEKLRALGHEVYDFRNPPNKTGFSWSSIDPNWLDWTPEEYRKALQHPLAIEGYASDIGALDACDTCVLVLPSGRSASWELGYAMGRGRKGFVFQPGKVEPELMYREASILATWEELESTFQKPASSFFDGPRLRQTAPAGHEKTDPLEEARRLIRSSTYGKIEVPAGEKGPWRIVESDNFGGDYPNESFLQFVFHKKEAASAVADILNKDAGENHRRYWRVVQDDYRLIGGFEP